MEKSSELYVEMLNSHKATGYMFKSIPMPQGTPILFTLINIACFSMFGSLIGNPAIMAIPCFILIWEHYTLAVKRNRIYDECIINEAYMQNDFKENGQDPNFPSDPMYITNEDRMDIFSEALYTHKKESFWQKLKSHHVFISIMMALYIITSLFVGGLFNPFVD